jgi:hypothetical protein
MLTKSRRPLILQWVAMIRNRVAVVRIVGSRSCGHRGVQFHNRLNLILCARIRSDGQNFPVPLRLALFT